MMKIFEEIYRNLNENKPDVIKVKKLVDRLSEEIGDKRGSTSVNDEEFRNIERMYRVLTSNIPNANVFVFDHSFKVLRANGREMEKYGFSPDHYLGNSLIELWSKEEREKLEPLYKNTLKGKMIDEELRLEEDYFNVRLMPIRSDSGIVIAGMSIITNISSEKKGEIELIKAKEEAEGANHLKTEFMANMSHEIRTPLNSIIGFTEQLGKTTLQNDQRNFLNLIADSSNHLLRVVNEILILMKIGSGSLYIEKRPFHIQKLFIKSLNNIKINAEKKGLNLKSSFSDKIPPVLVGDSMRLRQIIVNLLSNAVKFTQFGIVSAKMDAVSRPDKKIDLQIKISDTGIGIDSEELNTIFQPFNQADASITRKFGGSGLGLTIVKELIELQGGSIRVTSTKNKGTVFTVIIPLEIGEESDVEDDDVNLEYNTDLLKGIRVLLVDDDETNMLLAKTILNSWKIQFEEAYNGSEALEKLERSVYDLVLMDIHMPEISGLDVVKTVRKDNSNPNHKTKFVAVTANVVNQDLQTYKNAGMNGHLIKPYREEVLFNKMINILELQDRIMQEQVYKEGETYLDSEAEEKPYDLRELINVSKGDTYFYNKTLQSFLDSAENIHESITELNNQNNLEGIAEKAHKLISSSRFLGLSEIANLCVQIEDGISKNKGDNIDKKIDLLLDKLSKVINKLEKEYISN